MSVACKKYFQCSYIVFTEVKWTCHKKVPGLFCWHKTQCSHVTHFWLPYVNLSHSDHWGLTVLGWAGSCPFIIIPRSVATTLFCRPPIKEARSSFFYDNPFKNFVLEFIATLSFMSPLLFSPCLPSYPGFTDKFYLSKLYLDNNIFHSSLLQCLGQGQFYILLKS